MDSWRVEGLNKMSEIKNCGICSLPLADSEIEWSWTHHAECRKCYVCKNDIAIDLAQKFIDKKVDYLGHITCHETRMREEIEKRPVTVTQGMLDYLNNISLMCTPNLSRNVEDNQTLAEGAANKQWLHLSSLEEKYVALKMMQAVTASWSILLSNDKKNLDINIRREEFDKDREKRHQERMDEVSGFRVSKQREVEIKREKKSPDWKAIQGLVACGMSEDAAREFIKTNKKTKGTTTENGESVQ